MKQTLKSTIALAMTAAAAIIAGGAVAEPVSMEVLLTPQEQVKFDFADGSKHFVLAVRREGKAEGSGPFTGAAVTEIGWHDVNPPISAEPQGYLQLTADNGDVAILRWSVKATFVKGAEGKPALFNGGVWELVSGTGQFADKRGVGSLIIKPQGGPNLFILQGEVGDKV
ncbi:MAG TPA: hypothetical protein VHG92_15255 [Afifellaceae bacterium]|nr:hypothetical protein [Afifellaceae bacterium]